MYCLIKQYTNLKSLFTVYKNNFRGDCIANYFENDLYKITHLQPDKAFCKISRDQIFKV